MINDPTRVMDAFDSALGGADLGRHAAFIRQDQFARLINVTCRGGSIVTRPGIVLTELDHADSVYDGYSAQTWFEREKIQAMIYDSYAGGRLIAVIGGRPFSINPTTGAVVDLTGDLSPNRRDIAQAWAIQAEQYVIVQDGSNRPFIIEGSSIRRSVLADSEVPIGTAMGYGQGRIVVASPDGFTFVVGDVIGGSTSILKFTGASYLNGAPAFSMPRHMGPISGFAFIEQQDTGTGVGALLASAIRGTMAYDLSIPREQVAGVGGWIDNDIARVALGRSGFTGPYAQCNVNGDVFFRSLDGVRSYRMARAEINTWGRVPVSREMNEYTTRDTPHWLRYAQAANFDNRLLMTTAPVQQNQSFVHLGIMVLDFDLLGGAQGKAAPQWEGIWTGCTPAAIAEGVFNGRHRCFYLCADRDGVNRLYEQTMAQPFDLESEPIPAVIETKQLNFEGPYNLKDLIGMDLWLTDIIGEVQFAVYWRPDDYQEWTLWHTWSECASPTDCGEGGCVTGMLAPKHVPRRSLPTPPEACSADGAMRDLRRGFTFQFRIEMTGHCKITRARFHARRQQETGQGDCPTDAPCTAMRICPPDDFAYSIAAEYTGCIDRVLATGEFDVSGALPSWDLRSYRYATVQGDTWEIKEAGADGQTYQHGKILHNRMIGLPDFVTVAHENMELRAWCQNPFEDSDESGYSGYLDEYA